MEKEMIESPELKALANITLDSETMFIPETVDSTLETIREKALDFTADVSTTRGKDFVRAQSMVVRKIKTLWVKYGKNINREEKKTITTRNVELSKIEEYLDDLAIEVRELLTAQEEAEKLAKAKQDMVIKDLLYYYSVASDLPVETYNNLIEQIKAIEIEGDILSDYFIRATQSKESSLASLEKKLAAKIQYDIDQAELDTLRKEKAKRVEKEEAEQAIKDQQERALKLKEEAEAQAKIEAQKLIDEAEAATKKAEEEAKDLEQKAKAEAIRVEEERLEAIAKADRERTAAVAEAQRVAKEEAEAKERDRLALEAKETAAREKKAANKKHRANIERQAINALMDVCTVDADDAENIIKAISEGSVTNTSIDYGA